MKEKIKKLLDAIDAGLPNTYVVVDGDDDTLCIKERNSGTHYEIKVTEIED